MKPVSNQSQAFQTSWWIRVVRIAVFFVVVSCGALAARAFTAADADAIFDAHTKAFYRVTNGVAWHTKTTDGGEADYWMQAVEWSRSALLESSHSLQDAI
jgi:hypothetical protein